MNINKIRDLRKLLGMSQEDLAAKLGISQRDVSLLENGKRDNLPMSLIHYLNIARVDLNSFFSTGIPLRLYEKSDPPLGDLMTPHLTPHSEKGGSPLIDKGGIQRGIHSDPKGAPLVAIKTENPKEGIPLIPAHAIAGIFNGEINVLELECERFVVPVFKDAEFLIQVKGNSMYPKYNSGDIVACKKLPLDTFFQWNKVYVLDTDQGPLIKRVKKAGSDDRLLIVSDNATYEAFELDKQHIYNISIVIGVIRLE